VLVPVAMHVLQRAPHLLEAAQDVRVITVGKDLPAPPELAIDGFGDANREPLHPARQATLVLRLEQQVNVIALDRELHEPHAEPLTPMEERHLDALEHMIGTKAR